MQPRYESYCFARIPGTIERLLTGTSAQPALPEAAFTSLAPQYDQVIVFLVDAFGWRFYDAFAPGIPFLQRISASGVVSKLTSMFPSTTAAHVTCMHSGLPVARSGIYEWYMYEPLVDRIISPLRFCFSGDSGRDTLLHAGVSPQDLLPPCSFYSSLRNHGVHSFVYQDVSYARSAYSRFATTGAESVPCIGLRHGLEQLHANATSGPKPAYHFFYVDRFDSYCHEHGPLGQNLKDVADAIFAAVDEYFALPAQGKLPSTLLIVTADHGQVEVDPLTCLYLDEEWPNIGAYLESDRHGNVIAPAGSARDFFLHVRADCIDRIATELRDRLDGRAAVQRTADLVAAGVFGPDPLDDRLISRVGNLVVLPFAGESVFWAGDGGAFKHSFRGHHGGLTRQEMETVFIACELN